MKTSIAIVAALLAIAGNVPYLQDIIQKKVKPHPYTWLLYRASCSSDKSHVGQVSARFLQRLPRYSLSSFSYCRSSMALRTYDELIRIASSLPSSALFLGY